MNLSKAIECAAGVIQDLTNQLVVSLVPFGWKIIGAIVLWDVSGWGIGLLSKPHGRALVVRKFDPTLGRYVDNGANVVMRVLLIIAIFGVLGIVTTSFAALLTAVCIAIGAAWAGLLANFAAGVFLVVLRSFHVGDFVTADGITGTVKEVGLFATAIDTPDNVRTFVGNKKIFSDTIQNFTTNPHRREELTAQIAHSVNPCDAIKRLQARVA